MRRSDRKILILSLVVWALIIWIYVQENSLGEDRLCINEVMGKSFSYLVEKNSARERWIELYNGTDRDISLDGYGLSDNRDEPYLYRFEDVIIPAEGYLVIYAAGKQSSDGELYANFDLSPKGETVLLTDPDGRTIDELTYGDCISDYSYGRVPDGGEVALLKQATKGKRNDHNVSRMVRQSDYDSAASFSHEEGFYQSEFDLELSAEPGEEIYYTLDSSVPDFQSPVYKDPIHVYDRSDEPNQYADIRTVEVGTLLGEYGAEKVKKAFVVRARTARDGQLSEEVITRTYWIGGDPSLMTLSIVSDPVNLFDFVKGIYVPGQVYGMYVRSDAPRFPIIGNFTLRGKGGERPASIAFFEKGEKIVNQDAGIRIGAGRTNAGKSPVKRLNLYASYKHETKGSLFPAEIFPENVGVVEGYKRLALRNSTDFIENSLIDAYVNELTKNEGLGVQIQRPVIVYLNGEYWGISYMAEKLDADYIAAHYGMEADNVSLLQYKADGAQAELEEGKQEYVDQYLSLIEFAMNQDMSKTENYQYIADRLDIENFIKNYVIRMYLVNSDWPDNNVRMFRAMEPDGSECGDGKWRGLLYDNDYTCLDYEFNMFKYTMGEYRREGRYENLRPADGTYELFVGLMDNKKFRSMFKTQYEEYKRTIFDKEHMHQVLDEMVAALGEDYEINARRWTRTSTFFGKISAALGMNSGEVDQREEDEKALEAVHTFIDRRAEYMDRHMEEIYARYE